MTDQGVATVLDIDLDFFLSEITRYRGGDEVRQDDRIVPWSEADVREFLERQCLLSSSSPVQGAVVRTHDEVFWHWKDLVRRDCLRTPFNLIHVDAHADLGLGGSSWAYICTDLLNCSPATRSAAQFEGFDEGSYLAFAVACRWISSFVYVHHPALNTGLGDVPPILMKDQDVNSNTLQLKRFDASDIEANILSPRSLRPTNLEPEVPFIRIRHGDFRASKRPDLVFVSQSPLYTPTSSDYLLDTFKDYIAQLPPVRSV